jgi:hypothetical protein
MERGMTLTQALGFVERVLDSRARRELEFVTIVTKRGHVQFAIYETAIYGEAVSNAYLTGDNRLLPVEEDLLEKFGWRRPGEADSDGDIQANFFREWDVEHPSWLIVRDLMQALVTIYLESEDEQLRVTHNSFDAVFGHPWYERIPV